MIVLDYMCINWYIKFSNLKKNIFTIITTGIDDTSLLDLLVYTVWACLKATTLYNTLKEKSTNKNHYYDNYSASIRDARSLRFLYTYQVGLI